MRFIVFWLLLKVVSIDYTKEAVYDDFGRIKTFATVKHYQYDSIPKRRCFETEAEVDSFLIRMINECPECIFVKVDTVKVSN